MNTAGVRDIGKPPPTPKLPVGVSTSPRTGDSKSAGSLRFLVIEKNLGEARSGETCDGTRVATVAT